MIKRYLTKSTLATPAGVTQSVSMFTILNSKTWIKIVKIEMRSAVVNAGATVSNYVDGIVVIQAQASNNLNQPIEGSSVVIPDTQIRIPLIGQSVWDGEIYLYPSKTYSFNVEVWGSFVGTEFLDCELTISYEDLKTTTLLKENPLRSNHE